MSDKEVGENTSEEETSSSEEESSTSEEEWNEEHEKTFLKTLSSLKGKDPKIYDENVKFFEVNPENVPKSSTKKKKEEHLYLRDYERKIILEKGGILTDESDDETLDRHKREREKSPTYVEEQKTLKENFKKLLASDSEQSDSENDTAGFLKVKVKDVAQQAKEEEEYLEWLKGQKSELSDKEAEGQLKYLRDYWTNPKLNDGEQFLRDYILNKRYLEPIEEDTLQSEVPLSEDERELDQCDEYEQKYNFRFEEPDKDFIKTYPRNIENSLRRKDEKRKRKREERKKKKEQLLEQKRLEVKQLKKQKKQELLDRIKKIKELTGNKELGFDDKDLQDDFCPDEYDRKMTELFNEEFYAAEEDDEKPQFSDMESTFDSDEGENETNDPDHLENDVDLEKPVNHEITTENDDFIMDCDYDPQQASESKFKKQTRSSRRKGHKKSIFMQAVKKEKPVFNPADKTFQQYVDEYYGLEFEDIIDNMPCRFKYRKVMPNNFGLTVEEILAADDKELNKWCSMQKVFAIRPEQNEKFDLKIYARRAQNIDLKKKFLPSLFNNEDAAGTSESTTNHDTGTKKKKKKNRRKKPMNTPSTIDIPRKTCSELPVRNSDTNSVINKRSGKKRKNTDSLDESSPKKRFAPANQKKSPFKKIKFAGAETFKNSASKFKQPNKSKSDEFAVSDERLKAYGINPKKFKNKMKYGGRAG